MKSWVNISVSINVFFRRFCDFGGDQELFRVDFCRGEAGKGAGVVPGTGSLAPAWMIPGQGDPHPG